MNLRHLFLSLTLIACGSQSGSSPSIYANDSAMQSALESDTIPLAEDAEDPTPATTEAADADADLDNGETAEAPSDMAEPVEELPELTPEEAQKGAFFVRIAWGNFPINRDNAKNVVDYSGSLTVDADDALRRVRAWHFEKRDQIQRPRDSKSQVAFASHITVASDGLHALVLASEGTSTLVVKLGDQFEKSYVLNGDTLHIREVNASATAGQKIRVAIDRIKRRPLQGCPEGDLVGRWIKKTAKDGREITALVGRLMSEDGRVLAKLGGIAGERKNGEHVFFMKIGGRKGFVGLVKGTYDPSAKTFTGKVMRGQQEIGSVSGTYAEDNTFEGTLDLTACGS